MEDEEEVGPVAAQVVVRPEGAELTVSEGQESPGGNPDRYRIYRVRDGWVAQHLRTRLGEGLDHPAVEELTTNLLSLGTLQIDDRGVPVYLARSLDKESIHQAVDTALRARQHLGVGLVLNAGITLGTCLATNVLTPLIDHIDPERPEISLVADRLRSVYLRDRVLAGGGRSVELRRAGENSATLHIPGAGSIGIFGANRILVIERLVNAHNAGAVPARTEDLVKGIEDQSLSNIFKQPLWDKLKADFIRSPGKGRWEIAI